MPYAALHRVLRRFGQFGQQETHSKEWTGHRGSCRVVLGTGRARVSAGQPDFLPHGHRPAVIRQRSR